MPESGTATAKLNLTVKCELWTKLYDRSVIDHTDAGVNIGTFTILINVFIS